MKHLILTIYSFFFSLIIYSFTFSSTYLDVLFKTSTSNVAAKRYFKAFNPQHVLAIDGVAPDDSGYFSVTETGFLLGKHFLIRFPKDSQLQTIINHFKYDTQLEKIVIPPALKPMTSQSFSPNDTRYKNNGQNVTNTRSDLDDKGNYLQQLNLEKAWAITKGSPFIKIAVIDTGLNIEHEDLKNKIIGRYNATDSSINVTDINHHGTKVAGISAAESNNSLGIASSGFNCKLYAIRVYDDNGNSNTSQLTTAINHAKTQGVSIINISLGSKGIASNYDLLKRTIEQANNANISVIVAAGNTSTDGYYNINNSGESPPEILAPAALDIPGMITVGGAANGKHTTNSLYGPSVDVIAPYYVKSAPFYQNGQSQYTDVVSGTSYSTPLVAGIVGLMRSYNTQANPIQIEQALKDSAKDVGATGFDILNGHGFVDAFKALAHIDPEKPSATYVFTNNHVHNIGDSVSININIQDNFVQYTDAKYPISELINATLNYSLLDSQQNQTATQSVALSYVSGTSPAIFSYLLSQQLKDTAEVYYSSDIRDANKNNTIKLQSQTLILKDLRAPIVTWPLDSYVNFTRPLNINITDNVGVSLNSIRISLSQDPWINRTLTLSDAALSFDSNTHTLSLNLSQDTHKPTILEKLVIDKALVLRLEVRDPSNNLNLSTRSFTQSSQLDIYGADLKSRFFNAPNPFDPTKEPTYICFELSTVAHVRIQIFSLYLGRVATVYNSSLNPGYQEIAWDGRDMQGDLVPNGVYFCTLEANNNKNSIQKRCKVVVLRR
eukprot:COSAG01_NODE_1_length_100484_cov_170.446142_13_plen_779_part_00